MKNANVVDVRIGANHPTDTRGLVYDRKRVDRMSELFGRYPSVDLNERAEMLEFLKRGQQLEVGLVCGGEDIEPRVLAFKNDHKADLRLGLAQHLGFALVILGPVIALAWYYVR